MSERNLRFAVVGLGMGAIHCKDLADSKGCELVAVCDTNDARREQACQEYGVKGYASYSDLLADPDVDVVNICTPSGTHADLTVQALKAEKHVICEKPPDVSTAAVDRMVAAERESGKKVMIIFQARFEPLYREMKQAIDSGRLGNLIGVHGFVHWWRSAEYFDSPGKWKGTWKLDGGGSLANQGVHTLDLMQWLGGPVVEVYGKFGCFAHDIESEDKTVAVFTFANGALGTLTTTTAAFPGLTRGVMAHGANGSISTEDDQLLRWYIKGESEEAEKAEEAAMLARFGRKEKDGATTASDPFAFATRGHLMQFEAFAEALQTGAPIPNGLDTARHTVELFEAVYESGRTGKPVRLDR